MKKCVYPLIVYADRNENCYVGIFPDLDITASGNTVEETFVSAVDNLQMFLDFASKMDSDISAPSTYEETVIMNPKRIVLLGGVEVDMENMQLSHAEEGYKNFLSSLLEDKEG